MTKRYSQSKEINNLVSDLVQNGWTYKPGGKHGKLYPPASQKSLPVPTTPSCHKSYLNFRSNVRRAALDTGRCHCQGRP